MRRALCPVENLYVAQRSRAFLSCALRGDIDSSALASAFDALTTEHPTLRSRIVPAEGGHALELLPEDERPRLILKEGGDEAYIEELNVPLPVGGPLSRAALVTTGPETRLLTVTIDHTVTDGHSAITLMNALWDRYSDLVGTVPAQTPPVPVAEGDWPRPVSELLPPADAEDTEKYLRRRIEETSAHPVELLAYDTPRDRPADPSEHRIEVRRLVLGAEETTRLRSAARDAGVSVHGLVAAALMTAARARLDGDGPRTLGCMSPVDLRARLTPPVSPSVMVASVTSHLQAVPVGGETDPLDLARKISSRLRESVERGDHFHEMRIMPRVPAHPTLQMGSVIVTNMGATAAPRFPEGLEATDVRLVPARESYFPQAGRSPVMACVVSFDNQLAVELPHHTACFTPQYMRAFRDDVRTALLAFTEDTAPAPVTAG
ncbi:protein kinase [Streptomyces sp. CHA1]|uniref:Phthiocerol/phthiodiolone dimycocerosyl transferase n=1 Tax=Streptomyces sp. CNQ431 TaxID=1571532 RepID=A0A0E3M0V4_9ACTN|nr:MULTISPECIES: condensation domain-containing protein [unclassified Streptomyces]WSB18863.1 condensation domain-containing protein [Streptomyces albidoflavus]AKA54625.1 acyltransferase [Streptomyces sp. CNQ431]MBT3158231.1 protein kinase [Streptomyces sp. G11C]MCO6704551.1 protein kinase [Streptomyces sp. CHB9.2]MCO6710818.1 protein kinase [Streptomyces sp. CHA3]